MMGATSKARQAFCAAALSFSAIIALHLPANAQEQKEVEITLPQAELLAVQALKDRQPKLAYQLTGGLLQANPKSSFAYFVRAHSQAQLGLPKQARRSAARAYRLAENKQRRFEASELAAKLAYADQRPTLTQLWLRRAVQNAPNKQVEDQLGRDYGRVRRENPFSFSLRGGARPSNNVNNGADSGVQIVDGVDFTGRLSGSAQALSGTIADTDMVLSYRLRENKESMTSLSGRLYISRVALSSDAKVLAPDLSNSDLGGTFGEVSLRHAFMVGTEGKSAEIGGGLGQYWSGGDRSFDFAKIFGSYHMPVGENTRLSLNASVEKRSSALPPRGRAELDSTTHGFSAALSHKLDRGDTVNLSLSLRQTDGDYINNNLTTTSLRANYTFGEKIGPAKVSTALTLGYTDYPGYWLGFFSAPGGRQDKSAYLDVNMFFPDIHYAGFAPNLRVRAGRKLSNISRFETRELSVSLGIQSKF